MKNVLCILFSTAVLAVAAQTSDNPVLLRIDDKAVTQLEFETIYKKNNRDSAITKADLDEYIELFINFKLKVMEAEAMGRDTASQFTKELAGYREQLAAPYLVDKAISDSLVREAYNRLSTEIRASHILIKLPADPSPADTLAAYKKVMDVKEKVMKKPEKFGDFAKTYSEDPSASSNSGDLGYFTSLQMVYPFESLVYDTPVGEIGGPVRTRFGYHIVKTADKRKARGQIRVAHIMVRTESGDPDEVMANNQKRIEEVYERLEAGEDFAGLARKFSDDRSSAARGGELPEFGTGKMVGEFEEAAFALENPGDYTKPFTSPYGFHIVKLIEKIPLKSYEEMEKELRSRIGRDNRSDIPKNIFIAKRKKEYNFKEKTKRLKPFYKDIDTSYFSGRWTPPSKLASSSKVIFTLDGRKYTQGDFAKYLKESMRPGRKPTNINKLVDENYANFVSKSVMAYENSRLEEKHPEFKALLSEYRDGILLFDLTDEKVWSRAVSDSAGLADFYAENKEEFMWDERAAFDIYTVEDKAAADKVLNMLKKGKNQDEIRDALNESSALKVRVESGLKEREASAALQLADWEVGHHGPLESEGQMMVIHIKEIQEPRPKAFDEARGLITAAYQTYLENKWVEKLRSEHEVEVDRAVLYGIK
ncbi:MAG: peptidylprolyl isomerase [Cryomorphaceae bacterium]|nr:peptidylprolyl isomerase [Flavobacteriales bacterium]